MKKYVFILTLFLLLISNNCFASYLPTKGYAIDGYDVDIVVNENNTLDIKEKINVHFYEKKHGIFRTIPLNNTIRRSDETTYESKSKISKMKINDSYSTSIENGTITYRIGHEDRYVEGDKGYTLSYRYRIFADGTTNYDELYYNIIGTQWDTTISDVTFKITLPKEFDTSKIGFSTGSYGSVGSDNIEYNVVGNIITGKYIGQLNSYEGITIRIELPEGYFVQNPFEAKIPIIVVGSIAFFVILSFFLWYKFGRDDMVFETVEFYPPEKLNSAEVGTLYRGHSDSTDAVSLLVYLADKGYLKIHETQTKSLLGSKGTFEIEKIKDYDGINDLEKTFMDGLFKKKDIVKASDLQDSFYVYINKITTKLYGYKNKIFERSSMNKRFLLMFFNLLILASIIAIPLMIYGSMFTAASLVPFWSLAYIAGIVGIILIFIINAYMPKRTKYGSEMLGRISGFRNFLETAEKDKLEHLVEEDPTYFYKILPFTYVLGVSSKWIKKFESINIQSPDWYDSPSAFSYATMNNFMNSTMKSVSTSMTSTPAPEGSSGGGYSGGGFSGGGSGGGGGGSW